MPGNSLIIPFLMRFRGFLTPNTERRILHGLYSLSKRLNIDANVLIHIIEYSLYDPTEHSLKTAQMLMVAQYVYENTKHNKYQIDMALLEQVRSQRYDIVHFLLEKGAFIHDRTLDMAVEKGDIKIIKLLLEYGAYLSDCLIYASKHGNKELATWLISRGAPFYSIFEQESALSNAIYYGQLEMAQFLLDRGDDVHYEDDLPLYFAVCRKHYDAIRLLLENGADVNMRGGWPLKNATSNGGHEAIVSLLLEYGAQ